MNCTASRQRRTGLPSLCRCGFIELADTSKLLISPFNERSWIESAEFPKGIDDISLQLFRSQFWIAVRAAQGLLDDVVDQPVVQVVLGGERECICGLVVRVLIGDFPENRGAAFWADDRIPGVFQHGHTISDADAQGAATAPFADDDAEYRCLKTTHVTQVDGDRFSLSALFRFESWIRAGRIDKCHDGQAKLFGELHLLHRLTVAFGVRAAEVAGDSFLRGPSLLMSDDEHFFGADATEAGDDAAVVSEVTVAMQFTKVATDHVDVVSGLRSMWMPRDSDRIPRCQLSVDLLQESIAVVSETFEFFPHGLGILTFSECFDLAVQFNDWFLKWQAVGCAHGGSWPWGCGPYRFNRYSTASGLVWEKQMSTELGVLGVGHLASSLLNGVFDRGVCAPDEVLIADEDPARLSPFSDLGCVSALNNAELRSSPRILVAVRPQSFEAAAASVGGLDESHLVISVMAGIGAAEVQSTFGGGCRVVRVMPNTAAAIGQSMTTIAPGLGATEEDLSWVTAMFDAVGRTCVIDESMMSAATAVCGSGPGWVKLFALAMSKGACDVGFDAQTADMLVRQTLHGAAAAVQLSDNSIESLLESVATSGGTTEAGLAVMRSNGFEDAVRRGVIAARDRSDELAG